MSAKAKKELTTVQHLKRWKALKYTLNASIFVFPLIPAGIITGIHSEEWFGSTNGWSLGLGFGMLLVSFALTIIALWKKNDIMNSKVSGVIYLAIILSCWGFAFMFLASILNEFGKYFLYFALSLVGSGTADQINKSYVSKWVQFYQKLADDNGLTPSSAKQEEAKLKAQSEAESIKKAKDDNEVERQPTE